MSDQDIVDTITEAIHGLRVMAPVGALNGRDTRDIASLVIAALRERYAIIPKDELKLEIDEYAMPDSTSHRYVTSWKEGRFDQPICPNCGRKNLDKNTPKCYLC